MNRIDYTQPGGFPLEQPVLDKMQTAYYDALRAFIGYLKIPDIGNFVIHGCDVVGPNITPGMLWIDGDLCTFAGAAGTNATKIKKALITTTAEFENGSNIAVFTESIAQVDAAGAALSTFTRFYPVYDGSYVHTDNNFTNPDKTKLDGIEPGAEKNVQADWAVANPLSDAFIKNKPLIPDVLHMSDCYVGDVGTNDFNPDTIVTVTFQDVGTSDYQAIITPIGVSGGNANNDVSWVVFDKTQTSFKVALRGYSNDIQDIRLDYMLIRKTT